MVTASCSIQCVRNDLNKIKELYFLKIYLSSPLKAVLQITWKINWKMFLVHLKISIMFCLESRSFNEMKVGNKESLTKTSSFYKLKASFHFIASLVLTRSILHLTFTRHWNRCYWCISSSWSLEKCSSFIM